MELLIKLCHINLALYQSLPKNCSSLLNIWLALSHELSHEVSECFLVLLCHSDGALVNLGKLFRVLLQQFINCLYNFNLFLSLTLSFFLMLTIFLSFTSLEVIYLMQAFYIYIFFFFNYNELALYLSIPHIFLSFSYFLMSIFLFFILSV